MYSKWIHCCVCSLNYFVETEENHYKPHRSNFVGNNESLKKLHPLQCLAWYILVVYIVHPKEMQELR